jgi:hypothetical protein
MRNEPTTAWALMTKAILQSGIGARRLARHIELSDEIAVSCAAEIFLTHFNYDSNLLVDAVYDDRFGAELARYISKDLA